MTEAVATLAVGVRAAGMHVGLLYTRPWARLWHVSRAV